MTPLDPAAAERYAKAEARYQAIARARMMVVGQRVAVRDATGAIHRAVITEVPYLWRARRGPACGSLAWTTRGEFPKAWVRLQGRGRPANIPPVPWPIEDIFTAPSQLPERTDA